MKSLDFSRRALICCVPVAMLAGCGGSQPPIGAPRAMPQSNAMAPSSYRVLYSFGDPPDGNTPQAGVIGNDGTFYGTTTYGGAYRSSGGNGWGTVFSVTTAGTEKVLHNFGSADDGRFPSAGLIDVSGTLYGTTWIGGSKTCPFYEGCGTVFSIATTGTEKVLYIFRGGPHDGSGPVARLLDVKGTLYGTTSAGGKYCLQHSNGGCGTVFSITTSGAERILHNFGQGADGTLPDGGLVEANGTLYGTTSAGGSGCVSTGGCGTVFSITPGGAEKVLHSFASYPHRNDGSYPVGSLTVLGGVLYGTTIHGGKHGDGTVFSITTGGAEKVLCSFDGLTDGADPMAGLANVGGTLYGTTSAGGADREGTIFSVTTAGTEKVVHSFGKGADGASPVAGMDYRGGSLLGTTSLGGVHREGTVFSLRP
jgi:uncharacterized repeat protein (TIGR03803 family)